MICPSCGKENRDGAKLCEGCGKPLSTPAPTEVSQGGGSPVAASIAGAMGGAPTTRSESLQGSSGGAFAEDDEPQPAQVAAAMSSPGDADLPEPDYSPVVNHFAAGAPGGSKLPYIAMGVVAFVLGGILSVALGIGGGRTPVAPGPGDLTPAELPADTGSGTDEGQVPVDPSGKRSEGPEEGGATYADACLDAKGNPSVYAFCELNGRGLKAMLEDQGWSWMQQGEAGGWAKQDGSCVCFVSDEDGAMSPEDIVDLGAAGAGEEACFSVIMDSYTDVASILDGYINCSVEDSAVLDETFGIAVAYGPNMSRMFVSVVDAGDGDWRVDVFNAEALLEGMFQNGSYGYTAEEIFKNLAGRDLGSK